MSKFKPGIYDLDLTVGAWGCQLEVYPDGTGSLRFLDDDGEIVQAQDVGPRDVKEYLEKNSK
jgi:hypothetical protein